MESMKFELDLPGLNAGYSRCTIQAKEGSGKSRAHMEFVEELGLISVKNAFME